MAKKTTFFVLFFIALMVSSCVWYGGHGHGYGYYGHDYPPYGHHPNYGWDREIHGGGSYRR